MGTVAFEVHVQHEFPVLTQSRTVVTPPKTGVDTISCGFKVRNAFSPESITQPRIWDERKSATPRNYRNYRGHLWTLKFNPTQKRKWSRCGRSSHSLRK